MSKTGHGPGVDRWEMLIGTGQMSEFGDRSSQGQRVRTTPAAGRRAIERGAALVEFAFVALLLFALIFGIMSYAYMMSFRQAMTQATAEASRAAAIAPIDPEVRGLAALNEALSPYGITCNGTSLLRGSSTVGTCSVPPPSPCTNNATRDCVTVTVRYQYRSNPLLPSFPGLGLTLPETIGFTSIAEVS